MSKLPKSKKYKDVDQCMLDSSDNVQLAALEANMGFIKLDTKTKKLSICKQLTLHQQPLFTPTGQFNPSLLKAVKKQECNNLCHA